MAVIRTSRLDYFIYLERQRGKFSLNPKEYLRKKIAMLNSNVKPELRKIEF